MDKVQFKERWNNIFNSSSSNGLIAKLLYKKPLESNETRLDRHHKQQNQYQKKRYQEHKEQVIEYRKKYKKEHKERKKQERLLLKNDEPKRATEELARFTQEERRQYDLWEIEWNKKFKETQKHTVY